MFNQAGIHIFGKSKYDNAIFLNGPRIAKPYPRVNVIVIDFSGIKWRCICAKLINNYNIFKDNDPRSVNGSE